MDYTIYDEDYYERGIESGKSCYQNYRWMPELTIPMAMTIIDLLKIKPHETILDFGCAKGFLVKAFRLLHRDAFGVDISKYAISNADPTITYFCKPHTDFSIFPEKFNYCISKDVFEHIPEEILPDKLNCLKANKMFVVVPLGDENEFTAPANNFDKTHVTCKPIEWWSDLFVANNWIPKLITFRVNGIKDSYYDSYPESHGFFILENNRKEK